MKIENQKVVLEMKEHEMEVGMLTTLVNDLIEYQCRQNVKEKEGRLVDNYDVDLISEAYDKAIRLLHRRTRKDGETLERFSERKFIEFG